MSPRSRKGLGEFDREESMLTTTSDLKHRRRRDRVHLPGSDYVLPAEEPALYGKAAARGYRSILIMAGNHGLGRATTSVSAGSDQRRTPDLPPWFPRVSESFPGDVRRKRLGTSWSKSCELFPLSEGELLQS